MLNFLVIDGIYGNKGEAGMPGRFGYDGFPGNLNFERKHCHFILITYLNI